MKVFKTAKDIFLIALLWIVAIGVLTVAAIPKGEEGLVLYVLNFYFIAIAALLIWILLDTEYAITHTHLKYKSGPFRGKIDVTSIRKIEYDNSFFKTQILKPSLSIKGLIIFYNKFDEIYISPKDREEFISEILRLNPNIQIIK